MTGVPALGDQQPPTRFVTVCVPVARAFGRDVQREAEEAARVYAEFASSFDDAQDGGFKSFVRGEKINVAPGSSGRPCRCPPPGARD